MAWAAVAVMGVVLGLLGGGGGILTVPILVGLFGMTPIQATGMSLAVVGMVSLAGAAQGVVRGEADLRAALALAVPAMAGAFVARAVLVPLIPEQVGRFKGEDLLLPVFAVILVVVGIRMLTDVREARPARKGALYIGLVGFSIGLLSGCLGAGGGFLIVPALTLAVGLDIRRAIPTSLVVIALQSLAGFAAELQRELDWMLLALIIAVAMLGMVVGVLLRQRVDQARLRTAFATLLFLVATWMAADFGLNRF
ncbi:MAG: hypothetical protein HONBIEJF_02324 [Fimbriimonadaceae bacterium]|nr:hypothetical protein [Fimbriimonadaceae bacterium]